MTTRQLSFKTPPSLAIANGAVTPSPGATALGALAWSTTLNGLVAWNGSAWGSVGAGGTPITLDVGSVPQLESLIDVTDPSAKLTSGISVSLVGVGAGRDMDELEMDTPDIQGWVTVAGTIRFKVRGTQGPVSDTYRITYQII